MPTHPSGDGVFVSCTSGEFERDDGPFPGLRTDLRHYLTRAHCHMIVQEDFPQVPEGTVCKLAGLIRGCAALIHLVGEKPGATATAKEITEFLTAESGFLAAHREIRVQLGDCSGLTYTQWEAYIALHYGIPLFVYATSKGAEVHKEHLKRLELAGRFAAAINSQADLLGQLIGDIHTIIGTVPRIERKFASSRILGVLFVACCFAGLYGVCAYVAPSGTMRNFAGIGIVIGAVFGCLFGSVAASKIRAIHKRIYLLAVLGFLSVAFFLSMFALRWILDPTVARDRPWVEQLKEHLVGPSDWANALICFLAGGVSWCAALALAIFSPLLKKEPTSEK